MHLAWTTSPLWVLLNSLVAYRLTRLWLDDMIPPIPRLRDAVQRWASDRDAARMNRAILADRDDPEWHAEMDKAAARGREGFYTPSTVIGTQEQAEQDRQRLYGGTPVAAYLATCYWCSGFWISAAVVFAASLTPTTIWTLIALPFALSAVVGLLARLAD